MSVEAIYSWLSAPISGSAHHSVEPFIAWHGRLMAIAWLLLIPASTLIARFYKVTPRQNWPQHLDNPFWFIWHRRLGYLALILMVGALLAVFLARTHSASPLSTHAIMGWLLVILALAQIVNSLLRGTHGGPVDPFTRESKPPEQWPGDHFCMTRRRIVFECAHKYLGYLAILISFAVVTSGLYVTNAARWMWLGLGLAICVYSAAFIWLQSRGRCIDTYQAIWGTDPSLPGNLRKESIGWGVRRGKPSSSQR